MFNMIKKEKKIDEKEIDKKEIEFVSAQLEKEDQKEKRVLEDPQNDLEKALVEYPSENITIVGANRELEPSEVDGVVESVSRSYGIEKKAAYVAVAEIIRRGGHAAAVPPSFSVEVVCPEGGIVTVYKRDVVRFIELHTKGRRSFRNLAQTLGLSIVRSGMYRLDKDPESPPLSVDLARTINNRLLSRKEKGLSRTEMIGCASYAQHLLELDSLCQSERLMYLLSEDLEIRRKSRSGGNSKQNSKQNSQQTSKGKSQKKIIIVEKNN